MTKPITRHVRDVPPGLPACCRLPLCFRWIFYLPCFDPLPLCVCIVFLFFFNQTERRGVADVRGGFGYSTSSPMRQYPTLHPPTKTSFNPSYTHTTLQMHSIPAKLHSLVFVLHFPLSEWLPCRSYFLSHLHLCPKTWWWGTMTGIQFVF